MKAPRLLQPPKRKKQQLPESGNVRLILRLRPPDKSGGFLFIYFTRKAVGWLAV